MRLCALPLLLSSLPAASAYNARAHLIIVVDQLRGDYLERYRDDWPPGGLSSFHVYGTKFCDCSYNFANTKIRAPLATLLCYLGDTLRDELRLVTQVEEFNQSRPRTNISKQSAPPTKAERIESTVFRPAGVPY